MAKKQEKPEPSGATYEVIKGFNFGPDDVRVEPGLLAIELPAEVLADLIEAGAIVEVESGS